MIQKWASDFSKNIIWIRKNYDIFKNKWVALRAGELVDQDISRIKLQKRLQTKGLLTKGLVIKNLLFIKL